jgi:DNA-binding IclR family transcriptional regulator
MEKATKSRARGLDRVFAILDYLRQRKEPLRPNDIAIGLKAPKSSIYELTGLLVEQGILERVGGDGRVFLGRKLHFLGMAYLDNFDLTRYAQPFLEEITKQTMETSQLCMLDQNKYTVILMHEGSRQFRISSDIGERIPIPWTASGRLLLGGMSDEEILALIPEEDFTLPDGSVLDSTSFIASVRSAANEGFFSFDSLADTYTHCFAAPVTDVRDQCTATLCMIAPKEDGKQNYAKYRRVLINSADALSQKLAGSRETGSLAAG